MQVTIPNNAKDVMRALKLNGHEAYIVGGFVRDSLLGMTPKDIDIYTDADADTLAQLFPSGSFPSEARLQKITTMFLDDIEINQFRANGDRTELGNSIDVHLSTCDYTINSIAIDIHGDIYDPQGGVRDLNSGILRFVGDAKQRILEDPLRLLRGIRIAAKYDLNYSGVYSDLLQNIKHLDGIAVERIRDEFLNLLRYDNGISILHDLTYLDYIMPYFDEADKTDGGLHHDESVGDHLLDSFATAVKLTSDVYLLIAILFHDIGKPVTKTRHGNFHGHERESEEIVSNFLNLYKFSTLTKTRILFLVKNHMMFLNCKMTDRKYAQFFGEMWKCGVTITDMMILLYSDNQGNAKNPRVKFAEFCKEHPAYLKYHELLTKKIPFTLSDLAIDGRDVMRISKVTGKIVGETLNVLLNLVLDGKIENNRGALISYLSGTMGAYELKSNEYEQYTLCKFRLIDDATNIIEIPTDIFKDLKETLAGSPSTISSDVRLTSDKTMVVWITRGKDTKYNELDLSMRISTLNIPGNLDTSMVVYHIANTMYSETGE